MIFETLFLIGLIGFVAMALLGAVMGHGHGGGHGHAGGGHVGHGHGHALGAGHHGAVGHHTAVAHHGPATHHGTGTHGHGGAHGHGSGHGPSIGVRLLQDLPMFLSPLTLFSICLGMGAAGILLRSYVSLTLLWVLAVAGGLLFFGGVTRPLMGFILSFASKPSEGLEGMISKPAEATGNFDKSGKGVIRLVMDGEVVQLLAILDRSEREQGVRVLRGEEVVITEIDAQKGTCVVSRELGGSSIETF